MITRTEQLNDGGGRPGMLYEKWRAFGETLAGMGLVSVPFWAHLTDAVMKGMQFVTVLCGMLIGISGVYRIFFRKQRRTGDNR